MKKRPPKILVKLLCVWCIGIAIQSPSRAQCIPSSLQSVSYDTLIAGSGNDSHTFNFKKFNPALGTLVAAKVSSVVSVNYGFTLKNVESVARNFSVSVGRYDNFQSPEITTPYNNQFETPIGDYNLSPGCKYFTPAYYSDLSLPEPRQRGFGYGKPHGRRFCKFFLSTHHLHEPGWEV